MALARSFLLVCAVSSSLCFASAEWPSPRTPTAVTGAAPRSGVGPVSTPPAVLRGAADAGGSPTAEMAAAMARPVDQEESSFAAADRNHDGCVDAVEFALFEQAEGLLEDDADKAVRELKRPAMQFWSSFANSVMMIIVTELGDKTFFIAAILAMQHERSPVFTGAIGALAVMTVLSAAIGFALPAILPKQYTHYAAVALFVYFGIKLLKEAREHDDSEPNEELEEAERELGVKTDDEEKGAVSAVQKRTNWSVMTQTFTMTFLAEWGDRSQIATIALATTKDPIGVTVGGVLGHAMCTGLAVIGGKMLSSRISERTVLLAGGVLFCLFALHGLWAGSDD